MKDPMTIVGSNRQNIGAGVTNDCFEEREHWNDPFIQDHLPRMLHAVRRARFEMCGVPFGRLAGPERYLVRRGLPSFAHQDEHGVSLVLKNQDWLLKEREDQVHSTDSRGRSSRARRDSCPPLGGKDVQHAEGEQIRWNMWMLSLKTPHPNSPFGHALRNLSKAFQNNPSGKNVPLLWDSGVVCVKFQMRPFHWRNRRGANGIPRFSDPRYRDIDGFVLAVHRYLPRDMVQDIKAADLIEARIMDEEKGHIVGDHERRLLQLFGTARLHTFAAEYAKHLEGEEADEFRKRLAESEYDFAYQVELEHATFLKTYEDLDELLVRIECGLYFGGQTEEQAAQTVQAILNPPKPVQFPLKEVGSPEQPAPPAVFVSLREMQTRKEQKAATG